MMNFIYRWVEKLRNKVAKLNEKGQGMVEYAIILAVVAVVAFAVFGTGGTDKGLGKTLQDAFNKADEQINRTTNNTGGNTGEGQS